MTENPVPQAPLPEKNRWTIMNITRLTAAALGGVIVVIFLIGLGLAVFTDPIVTAPRIQIIRDIAVIAIGLEAILIIVALAVLIIQVTRLIIMLKTETKPVLKNAQDAVASAKGTVDFVGSNVTEPIVRVGSFMAGAKVLVRDLGGIRRAVRRTDKKESTNGTGK